MTIIAHKDKKWIDIYEAVAQKLPHKSRQKGFKKWFMENERDGILFDTSLIARSFTIYQEMMKRDKDHFTLIVGTEGTGKTTLGLQMCAFIDPNFGIDNVCFTVQDYIRALRKIKPGGCILLDEGGVTVFSREAMSANNVSMTKVFMLQRQKNVSVVVCCPSFWDVDTYIRKHRVNTLIRLTKQGEYFGYLKKAIDIINDIGYRKKKISAIKIPTGSFWHGKFKKDFPGTIDRPAYILKKGNHLDKFLEGLEKDFDKEKLLNTREVAKILGTNADAVWQKIARGSLEGTKIGGKWFVPKSTFQMPGNP